MKIKKVDDKPMVIHTKRKAKIHSHKPKSASIKGSNVYTVNRGPKVKATAIKEKKNYRRSTVHGTKRLRENGLRRFRRAVRESNQSIKLKETKLHIVGRTGAKVAVDQMEGGKEVQEAAYLMHEAASPMTRAASKGAELFRRKAAAAKTRKIKRVKAGEKLSRKATAASAKNSARKAAAQKKSAVAGKAGNAAKDTKVMNRSRKIQFFLDKMKSEENQQDSIAKLAKDLVTRRAMLWVKTAAPAVAMALLVLVLLVAMVAVPVVASLGVLYNSPFALFMPSLESGDTVQSVTSAYVAEFNSEINTLASEHSGYDSGQIIYVDYEGTDSVPSNYYDIMAVYMVKYGVGDTATIMNDTSKAWLKSVVDDMCSYTTSEGSESSDDGGTITVLYVNVTLKSYRDMISEYGFGSDEVEMLEQMMSADFMGQLGWIGGSSGESGSSVCSLTEEEINEILSGITDSTLRAVCDYALHRVGYPYSQEYRNSGDYYDCSSLAYYSWQNAGKSIAYNGATTAAAEAQGLDSAGKTVSYSEIQPGDLIFYSYTSNGRYKNISHVAVYVGNGKVVEAANSRTGVVYRDVPSVNKIVMVGRP